MEKGFRESMRWLHTWSGLIVGWLLFAIFVTGTSAYYREEINLWMKPEFHKSQVSEKTIQIAVDKAIENTNKSDNVSVTLPDSRNNLIAIRAEKKSNTETQKKQRVQKSAKTNNQAKNSNENKKRVKKRRTPSIYYDATTGELIEDKTKTAGGNFLYRFHFELYGIPKLIGRWIVGIATMAMLVAIITGILIHKRIFKDIFTFRPKNNTRGWMDAHILPAVAALPFLIMITYSGLLLFGNLMFPYGMKAYYGNDFMAYRQDIMRAYSTDSNKDINKEKAKSQKENRVKIVKTLEEQENKNIHRIVNTYALRDINKYQNNKNAQRLISTNASRQITLSKKNTLSNNISKEKLLTILNKAEKIWPENIGGFSIVKKGNNTFVEITPKDPSTLFSNRIARESITYNARTTELIKEVNPPVIDSVVLNTNTAFRSLHEAKFADSTLRFIFFLAGIMGTVIAGTGLVLWIEKRKKKNLKDKSFGFWLVEKLNLGTIMGLFIAIAIFFIANKVIIVEENERRSVEITIFFIAWLFSYIHAFLRNTSKAWKEQLLLTAVLFFIIPILNAIIVYDNFTQIFNRDNIFIYFDIFSIFMSLVFLLIRFILIRKDKRKGEEK